MKVREFLQLNREPYPSATNSNPIRYYISTKEDGSPRIRRIKWLLIIAFDGVAVYALAPYTMRYYVLSSFDTLEILGPNDPEYKTIDGLWQDKLESLSRL